MDSNGKIVREILLAGQIPVRKPLGLAVNLTNELWKCDPKQDSILVLYYQRNYLFFINYGGQAAC